MFDKLSSQELEQIFTLNPISGDVKKLITQECENEDALVLQDHAFGEYWNRKLKKLSFLEDKEIDSILMYLQFPTAKGVLGDAAIRGMLNKDQCNKLLKVIPESEWAFKTIKSRELLFEFFEKVEKKLPDITSILNQFIELKMTWAILEILPNFSIDELLKLKERMTQKNILSKYNRHLIREGISKILKKRR